MSLDISYRDYKRSSDIHGSVLYPATMVAPIQYDILTDIMNRSRIGSVFDPFHGSGTALYETARLSPQIDIFGCDINPLANLITKAKLGGVDENIEADVLSIIRRLKQPCNVDDYAFPNMHKWLREDVVRSLACIRSAIIDICSEQNRLFFWCMLCDVIRRYSNTRSSTYKLHIKEASKIHSLENKSIQYFINSIQSNLSKFAFNAQYFELYKCDVLEFLGFDDQRHYDLTITSPPYGDNATTVPYGQFSMLSLYTIDENDLELEGWELDNYSIIDNRSLGGRMSREININYFQRSLLEPFLSKISEKKHKKVLLFFDDYFSFLDGICKVTRKFIALTLGNRTVDRVRIDLASITQSYLENNNFERIMYSSREIPVKRTPKVTSRVYKKPVSSMNQEFIMVFERN